MDHDRGHLHLEFVVYLVPRLALFEGFFLFLAHGWLVMLLGWLHFYTLEGCYFFLRVLFHPFP